jgi:ATP-binding cassette, subfamily B (MDR/TAP), member 1
MFETIKRKPEIDAYDTTGRKLDDILGDIELREVCFSYPTRPNELIFNAFSLSISSGTTVALVGQSGSGKSTVINLIERFYDPQDGQILIDGIDLREFQLKWIRQKIGLVSQEPFLFTCSIKENIAYGKDAATNEEIRAAAELANAANFIDKFPLVSSHFLIYPSCENFYTVLLFHNTGDYFIVYIFSLNLYVLFILLVGKLLI